jgi:hypothetical protein
MNSPEDEQHLPGQRPKIIILFFSAFGAYASIGYLYSLIKSLNEGKLWYFLALAVSGLLMLSFLLSRKKDFIDQLTKVFKDSAKLLAALTIFFMLAFWWLALVEFSWSLIKRFDGLMPGTAWTYFGMIFILGVPLTAVGSLFLLKEELPEPKRRGSNK